MKPWIGPAALTLLAGAAGWHSVLTLSTYGRMEGAIRRLSGDAGLNTMRHGSLPTPDNQPVVRPSPDLAYSSCPFDLSEGPVEVSVTPVPGRYSSLSIFDARTDVVFVRNDQQAKETPYKVVIAREGQGVPKGVEVVRVNYDRGIALVRLLLNTPAEIKALEGVRRQSSCRQILTGRG